VAAVITSPRARGTAVDTRNPLVLAALGTGFAWLLVILFWGPAPFALTFDDAWYYAEIGRNLAHGHGSTFDTINETNGYHPLWQAICVLPRLVGLDGTAAMRAQLAIQLACWTAAVVLVVRMVKRPSRTLAAAVVLVVGNPFVLRCVGSGLESGLVVLAGALLLTRASDLSITDEDPHGRRRFGLLLAFAFLARTDAMLLTAFACAWLLPDLVRLGRVGLQRLGQLVAIPAATLGAYVVLNMALFGRPLQISGDIKRVDATPLVSLGVLLIAIGALALGRKLHGLEPSERFPQLTSFLSRTGWYAAFCVGIVGYYTLLSSQQWLWYFAPLVLYGVALLVHGGADLLDGAAAEGPRSERAIQAILLLPLVGGFLFLGRQFLDPNLRSIQEANRDAGEWISANLPEDAVIASWDAGALGAFTDQPVVNLDGVVNSGDFADALEMGTAGAFLRNEGVTHIANHGDDVGGDDPQARELVDGLYHDGSGTRMDLVHAEAFQYSGSTTRGGSGLRDMAVFVYELPDPSEVSGD
jgi:hypothetical protein